MLGALITRQTSDGTPGMLEDLPQGWQQHASRADSALSPPAHVFAW